MTSLCLYCAVWLTHLVDFQRVSFMTKDKSDKKNTSLRLPSKTLKALKIRSIEEDTSVQAILEQLVDEYLKNTINLKKLKK